MPKRQYHNLDGLLRDGLACFQAEGDEAAWERLVALARFISDVLDVLGLPAWTTTPRRGV